MFRYKYLLCKAAVIVGASLLLATTSFGYSHHFCGKDAQSNVVRSDKPTKAGIRGTMPSLVNVSGTARTAFNVPIPNARVFLMDETGEIRRTATSGFGYFRFTDVPTGDLYIIFIEHRRYMFATPSYLIEVYKDRSDIHFWGELIY
jgi:hypothetical protein